MKTLIHKKFDSIKRKLTILTTIYTVTKKNKVNKIVSLKTRKGPKDKIAALKLR